MEELKHSRQTRSQGRGWKWWQQHHCSQSSSHSYYMAASTHWLMKNPTGLYLWTIMRKFAKLHVTCVILQKQITITWMTDFPQKWNWKSLSSGNTKEVAKCFWVIAQHPSACNASQERIDLNPQKWYIHHFCIISFGEDRLKTTGKTR